jgi:uncharacterized protein (UPF0261 family)
MGFHANGMGGNAMEELVGEGHISRVLDITPHEIADTIFGGCCTGAGPDRLETADRMSVPMIFAPGGLDMAVYVLIPTKGWEEVARRVCPFGTRRLTGFLPIPSERS